MPSINLKWANFNLAIRIKLNDGALIVLGLISAFVYCVLSKWIKPMADNFLAGMLAVVGITSAGLTANGHSNKLDVDAAKAGPVAVVALNNIKAAAAGGAPPCPPAGQP
jgi:hypothetical protein